MARAPASALYVGLMSGTSMDGADAVIARCDQAVPEVLAVHAAPYPDALRGALLGVQARPAATLDETLALDAELGEWYAQTIIGFLAGAGLRARDIRAIGCHGQTVRHLPSGAFPRTAQIGDLARLATRTGITTVGDFRRMDIAAGGQGAPLAPLIHRILFAAHAPAAVVNLGGIANVSVLGPGGQILGGFDTGPGNALLDAWAHRCIGTRHDDAGALAARGAVNEALLDLLTAHPFFVRRPPKSTGRDEFALDWVDTALAGLGPDRPAGADVQATLAELTARTVAQAVITYAPAVQRVVLCGGGVYNTDLVTRIATALGGLPVTSSDTLGVPATVVEAVMMAWLACARLTGRRLNTGPVTGARSAVRLGCVYRP